MNNPTGMQNGSMVSSLGVCDIYAYLDSNGDETSVSPTFKKVTVD